jgi:hypothetical protein
VVACWAQRECGRVHLHALSPRGLLVYDCVACDVEMAVVPLVPSYHPSYWSSLKEQAVRSRDNRV